MSIDSLSEDSVAPTTRSHSVWFILLWLVLAWASRRQYLAAGSADLALMFAVLVVVPLGLRVFEALQYRRLAPWLGLSLPLSYLLGTGTVQALVVIPWTLFTLALVAQVGWPRSDFRWEMALEKGAVLYLAVGGFWAFVARTGQPFLGFDPVICLLTANHFHYAGFAAALIASRARRLQPLTAACILICPILIAIGITAVPLLEWVAAVLFASALLVMAASNLMQAPPLLKISYSCLFLTMPLAGCYALAEYFPGVPALTIPKMIPWHGLVNAFGFSFLGLLALDSQRAYHGASAVRKE